VRIGPESGTARRLVRTPITDTSPKLAAPIGGLRSAPPDAFLGVAVPRPVGGRHETQIRAHGAALIEAVGILPGEHEGQRRERPDPLDLPQQCGLRAVPLGDGHQSPVVLADALTQRADLLQDGPEGRHKRFGDVLGRPLVEVPRQTFGQAMTEGLHHSSDMVDQLRAATDQRLPRAD
jgi:hypothetical protein